jgi:hypothetical protein
MLAKIFHVNDSCLGYCIGFKNAQQNLHMNDVW